MNRSLDTIAHQLCASTPAQLDLTLVNHADQVHAAADWLLEHCADRLDTVEQHLFSKSVASSIGAHLAAKLARSKSLVRSLQGPLHTSVVFAVYKESQRILPRSESEVGEDFLRRKLRQLDWLFGDHAGFEWDLWIVDDGCPEDSGAIAERIIAADPLGAHAHVLYLEDAINQGHPIAAELNSTADSQKGASIEYGMAQAVEAERTGHIVAYTDADLSTNVGQLGLLIDGILNHGMDAAIGSRRRPTSVTVKRGQRNVRGKLFIFLWKRLLAPLRSITDTQCGFKAFRAEVVRDLLTDMREKKFAFDLELLLKIELHRPDSIVRVPIAWIDSEAASTTRKSPYLSMLNGVIAMYRRYLPPTAEADAYAAFIESLDELTWQRLLDTAPTTIADGNPELFVDCCGVTIDDMRRAVG